MAFIPPETIEKARQVDLLTYLKTCEPNELVHISGNHYCTREHDSLKISNGKWYWFSRGFGGYNALDYLIKVKEVPFMEAVERITGQVAYQPRQSQPKPEKPKVLLLPQASHSTSRVHAYLRSRGIDSDLIDFCIQTGRLYESTPHHNAVFVGLDKYNKPRYANLRGLGTDFVGDASGSDKRFSFSIPAPGGNTVHLFESAIDLLSYATLVKMNGGKEYMTDLTSRDQRMMLSVLTIVHLADTKAELDADTDALLKVAADHMCQMAVLRYQQLDGLNTALPIGTRKIDTFRTLTTESLAVFMPFKVQEIQEPGGIYFGENAISHNLILCNMKNLLNQSMMLLGIPDYVLLIEAVMMQESGGRGTDPMQCSECNFNTLYPHTPGAITDPEYSVNVGIQNLADCLQIAQCESPVDIDAIKLALQGYNYGQGYITWAMRKYGEYSKGNAIEFSLKTAEQYGWSSYGDMDYVPHVLRYYPLGQIFYDPDTTQLIVEVAASQVGNVGGEPYWSWYGFSERVEWCACFVSWCANKCGYLDTIIPKFAGCSTGVHWFKTRNQWADRTITPEPGMIIFFDWDGDGVPDHTGIVEKSENTCVYTIEGNTSDSCRRRQYTVGDSQIFGYGIPAY